MTIKYRLHDTPRSGEEGAEQQPVHARAIARGTLRLEELCEMIKERSALTSADVKGVLDSFFWIIAQSLKYGDNVELEGLGLFSPSLRTERTEEGRRTVRVDNVNFRCSKKLKQELKNVSLKRVERTATPGAAERRRRLLEYLAHNGSISMRSYAALAGCSRYRATADLKGYVGEGLLCRQGGGTHAVYVMNLSGPPQEP